MGKRSPSHNLRCMAENVGICKGDPTAGIIPQSGRLGPTRNPSVSHEIPQRIGKTSQAHLFDVPVVPVCIYV